MKTFSIFMATALVSTLSYSQDWQTSSNGSQYRVIYGDFSHGRDPNGPGYDGFALEKDIYQVREEQRELAIQARNEIARASSRAMPTAGTVQGQTIKSYFESYRKFVRLTYFKYTSEMLNGTTPFSEAEISITNELPDVALAILIGVDEFEAYLESDDSSKDLKDRFKLSDVSDDLMLKMKLAVAEGYTKVTVPFFLEVQYIVFKKEASEKKSGLSKGEAALIRYNFNRIRKKLISDPLSLTIMLYAQRISLESPMAGRDIPNNQVLKNAVLAVYAQKTIGANYKNVLTPQFLKDVSRWAAGRSAGQMDFYTTTSKLEEILKPFLAK